MGDVTGIERTLVLLKPDAVTRGLVGRVLSRFEEALLKVVACKMVQMDADLNRQHYFDLEDRFGPEVYNAVASFMQTGPVFAFVLEGVEAVAIVRKLVGATYPDQAAPGTIRKEFAISLGENSAHGSDGPETAAVEIAQWFSGNEIVG